MSDNEFEEMYQKGDLVWVDPDGREWVPARAHDSLTEENAVLKSAVVGLLRLCEETRNERGLPYIYPYASEIVEAKQALALLTAEEQEDE